MSQDAVTLVRSLEDSLAHAYPTIRRQDSRNPFVSAGPLRDHHIAARAERVPEGGAPMILSNHITMDLTGGAPIAWAVGTGRAA
jgi:hypothetical protein